MELVKSAPAIFLIGMAYDGLYAPWDGRHARRRRGRWRHRWRHWRHVQDGKVKCQINQEGGCFHYFVVAFLQDATQFTKLGTVVVLRADSVF